MTATAATRSTEGNPPDAPHDDDVGVAVGDTLGRYRVVRALGAGAMGAVFEAVYDDIGRRVALKVLLPSLARREVARTRFFREARAAARVHHPGVVQVHDVDVEGEVVYFVMALLDGETLARRIERGPLTPAELVAVLSPALDGVAAAHEAGVVHRDLKPANILLAATPEGPRAVVVDFGVSRLVDEDSDLTGSLAVLGTPAYMSPEQARGARDVGAASDQFSLGAVLFACLAGRRPFDGQSPLELAWNIQRNQRPALARLCPDAPPALVAAIERAMAPLPADRFPSVRALADALRRSLVAPARPRVSLVVGAAAFTTLAALAVVRALGASAPAPHAAPPAHAALAPAAPTPAPTPAAPVVAPSPVLVAARPPPAVAAPVVRLPLRARPPLVRPRPAAAPPAPEPTPEPTPEPVPASPALGRNRAPVLGR
jgi:serine/threonine-protein kinase